MITEEKIARSMMTLVMAASQVGIEEFCRKIGVDYKAVVRVANAAAQEEFETIEDMPEGQSQGRLQKAGLTDEQDGLVREALVDTFVTAFLTAKMAR